MGGTKIIQPSVTIALANADREVGNDPQTVLLVGQIVTAGSVANGSLTENISSSGAPENALFGEDSMLASMVRAFKRVNKVTQVDCLALDDDGSGVPATWTLTLTGAATASGSLSVTAGSQKNSTYTVGVPSGSSVTAAAALVVSTLNADAKIMVTASNVAGVVTFTAVNDGSASNDLPIGFVSSLPGITGHVAFGTAGSADPATTGIFDVVGTKRYQTVVYPYASVAKILTLKTFLDARFNPTNSILDGVGIVAMTTTFTDAGSVAGNHNSPSLVIISDKVESATATYKGPAMPEPSFDKAATFAAIRSLRLTKDASISQYLTSSASLDQFGGTALASMPYFNTPVPQMPLIPAGFGWTTLEIEQLTALGLSVMGVNPGGDGVLLGEMVTTYLTDPASNPDPTWTFLNYVDTGSNAREYFWNNLRKRFAQSRLTEGAVARGRDMANAVVIRAYCERLYQNISGVDFVLAQDGEDAIQYFKDNLTITLDLAEGKVTITMLVPIVTQLRQIIATMKVSFSTEG